MQIRAYIFSKNKFFCEISTFVFRLLVYLCNQISRSQLIKKNRVSLREVEHNSLFLMVLAFLVSNLQPVFPQEMLGIVNSSYAGITGSVINPAVSVTSPYYIDINLVAADIFFENNYIYMAKEEYRFSRFFSKDPQFPTHGEENNLIVYDYYNTKDKKAYSNLRLIGPSFSVTAGRHSFGLVTGARVVMSAKNVPYEIAKFGFHSLEYPPQYDINYVDNRAIKNAELGWAEFGFNYSYVLKQQGRNYWAVGTTFKILRGYAGGYFSTDNIDYIVLDRDTLIVHNINAEAGYSLPINYETNEYLNSPFFKGKGIGLDLGVIYQKNKNNVRNDHVTKLCSQTYTPYKYKIGISLLDIGRVKFKENSEKLIFNDASTYWPGITWLEYTNIRDLTDTVSQMFYGNNTQLVQQGDIKVALPTAISIQADYNYNKNWYINGSIIYPVQLSKSGIIRPVIFGITPRYQTANFEASLPLTLYDWTRPRIGISARYRGFFIGTDKLSGFFHYTDFTGIDFYFGIKFSILKGDCRKNTPEDNCGYDEYKKYIKEIKKR